MTDAATSAPAATPGTQNSAAAPSPSAAAALQPNAAQDARGKIELLTQNGDWVKRYWSGDVNAIAEWKALHDAEANAGGARFQIGGMSPQEQRNIGANRLEELGLPKDVVDHYRNNGAVSVEGFRLAQARWDSRKADPEWRAKKERGDFETLQEYGALLAIRSSRVDPSLG